MRDENRLSSRRRQHREMCALAVRNVDRHSDRVHTLHHLLAIRAEPAVAEALMSVPTQFSEL